MYVYVLVRQDLSPAQQIVQAAHAAREAGQLFPSPSICSLILCGVADEAELLRWHARIEPRMAAYLFREPDIGDQATALSTGPIQGATRRLFRDLPLWSPR